MKKFMAFLCGLGAFIQLATAQVQSLSIDVAGKNLETVLDEITSHSGVVFSYDKKIADFSFEKKGRIEGNLKDVLDSLFDGTGILLKELPLRWNRVHRRKKRVKKGWS